MSDEITQADIQEMERLLGPGISDDTTSGLCRVRNKVVVLGSHASRVIVLLIDQELARRAVQHNGGHNV
jgi:hypothetical protein